MTQLELDLTAVDPADEHPAERPVPNRNGWEDRGRTTPFTTREHILRDSLAMAVPMRIRQLAELEPATRWKLIEKWRATSCEAIASRGDDLQFGSKKRGRVADVFNELAKGLACLAYCPGGVDFAGLHFEATTPEGDQLTEVPRRRPVEDVHLPGDAP